MFYTNCCTLFFFFFSGWKLEIHSFRLAKSACNITIKCGEISSIYTRRSGMLIAYLARLWATLLHSLLVWEYSNWLKLLEKILESSIQGPIEDRGLLGLIRALITTNESPSKTALLMAILATKDRAVAAARASTSQLLKAYGIFLEQEVITEPELSLITTPIPDLFSPEKTALSKLIFTMSSTGGAFQNFLIRAGFSLGVSVGVAWQARNLTYLSLDNAIQWIAVADWFRQTWFLWDNEEFCIVFLQNDPR